MSCYRPRGPGILVGGELSMQSDFVLLADIRLSDALLPTLLRSGAPGFVTYTRAPFVSPSYGRSLRPIIGEDSFSKNNESTYTYTMSQQTVIALMGPQGPYKTSFITASLGGQANTKVHLADSSTSITGTHVELQSGHDIVLVEVPSLDEPSSIVALSRFLTVMSRQRAFAGAIYLQPLEDTRSRKKDFALFSQMLGAIPAQNTALVTVLVADETINAVREDELRREYWQEAITRGARVARFSNGSASARTILEGLFTPAALRPPPIQAEGVVQFLHAMLAKNKAESVTIKDALKTAQAAPEDNDLIEEEGKTSDGLSSLRGDLKQLLRSLEAKHRQFPFSFSL
ncbi:hypothetical protein EYR38_010354 [Pleurotus pulmonarius]|nr:hypothetical protein EYR38_010354 [Pleurotus pulmonarius]